MQQDRDEITVTLKLSATARGELLAQLGRDAPAEARPCATVFPTWIMPLLRLLRGEAGGDLGRAWGMLPARLPAGAALPTVAEAARQIVRLGLAERFGL